jgi:hypothetical protein
MQFQQVHIPSVGTVRLVQQPATLDVASKLIHPPQLTIQFNEDGWLTRHQLWYFGTEGNGDESATRQALQDAGIELRKQIEYQAFTWNGIGTFTYQNQKLQFEPQPLPQYLQPVAAERVIREGVQHSVLVGDQVVLSDGHSETVIEERQRNWSRISGWAIVVLALFFILFYLYQHQFRPQGTGLRNHVTAAPAAATYQQ